MLCKDTEVADVFGDLIARFGLHKKLPQPFVRNVGRNILRIDAGARLFDHHFTDVRTKNLDIRPALLFFQYLKEKYREGINFLPG